MRWVKTLLFGVLLLAACGWLPANAASATSLQGNITSSDGIPVANAIVRLYAGTQGGKYEERATSTGAFRFENVGPGEYKISVEVEGRTCAASRPFSVRESEKATLRVQLCSEQQPLQVSKLETPALESGGGEHLSREQVSSLPLNARDFSKLLLLAAGTMTDSNGAANFTQQFAINGQRGSTAVFALDGGDTTDPEMGGATSSNFNVDAIQEVQSSSGVMPAEIGHGAAGSPM